MQKPLDARPRISLSESRPRFTPTPIEPEQDSLDLLGIVRTLWRGRWIVALCGLLLLGYGWYQANVVAVPIYRATATLAVEFRTERVVNLDSVLSGVSTDEYSMNTEMEIIRSRELIGRLVDQLDLTADPDFNSALRPPAGFSVRQLPGMVRDLVMPPPVAAPLPPPDPEQVRQNVISAVQGSIETAIGTWSYIFTISATTRDPEKSALLANTLAQIYRDDQIALKVEATENAAIWLSDRVSELQAELEAKQGEINDLRSRNALVSAEALAALNAQSVEIGRSLQDAEVQQEQAEARVAEVEATIGADAVTRAVAASDPQLQALAAAVAEGDAAALLRFDRRFDQVLLQLRGDRDRARSVAQDLADQAARLRQQFDEQSAELVTIQQLERETEATRVLYETFLTRLKETTVQIGVHQADSRILSEATPGQNIYPRKTRIMGTMLLAGLVIGTAIVLLREFLQNTFRTSAELEMRSRLSVLGQIPKIPAKTRTETISYLVSRPTSAAAEAIRNLRTSVLLSNVDDPPQIIMLTSSVPGEGKTTLSIALSQNLAGLGKRVLLIEGDVRRRTFGAYFPDARDQGGLLSVMSGKVALQDALFQPSGLGIDVLMGEKSSINAADAFASAAFRDLLAVLRQHYDYIVIDTPPVLVVPDARVIAQNADAVVYLVGWDKTGRNQVEEGLKQFRSVNAHVTGMVLSQIDPKGMKRYGYGGRYGAYSAYSKGYYDN